MSPATKYWIKWAYRKGYRVLDDGTLVNPNGRPLKATPTSTSYPTFKVGSRPQRTLQLHVFAAYCRYGEVVLRSECVRHRDGSRTNCAYDNVVPGARKENAADIPIDIRLRIGRNAGRHRHKRTAARRAVRDKKIVNLRAKGKSWAEIAAIVHLDKARIGRILREQGVK